MGGVGPGASPGHGLSVGFDPLVVHSPEGKAGGVGSLWRTAVGASSDERARALG